MAPLGHGTSGPEAGGGTTPPPSSAVESLASLASPPPASAWPPEEPVAPELPELLDGTPEDEPVALDPLDDDAAGEPLDPLPLTSLGDCVEDSPHEADITASAVLVTATNRRMSRRLRRARLRNARAVRERGEIRLR
jgi:hypothetical protein